MKQMLTVTLFLS